MTDAVQKLFDQLEESRARFLDTLSGLDDAQLSFRPRTDAWSALEVAEHVLTAEQLATDTICRLAGRPSRSRNPLQKLGYGVVWLALKARMRVKAPARVLKPTGDMSLRQIRTDWDSSRTRLLASVEKLGPDALQQAGFGHPIAGPLNLHEGLLFLLRHTRHHQQQLERLKRHARFPRAAAALTANAG